MLVNKCSVIQTEKQVKSNRRVVFAKREVFIKEMEACNSYKLAYNSNYAIDLN